MKITNKYEEGIKLFEQIVDEEEDKKNDYKELSFNQNLQIDTKIENILTIASGSKYHKIVYVTDDFIERDNPDPERQKLAFKTISIKEVEKINLLKNYFDSGDLNPLQEYYDKLFEG